jgi:hypothetical protein
MPAKGNHNGDESATEVTTSTRARMARMVALMEREATAAIEETEFTGDDILSIWEAESEEEMWDADNRAPLGLRDLVGCELEVFSVEVKYGNRADIKSPFVTRDGKPMYLWIGAYRTRETGQENTKVNLPDVGTEFYLNTSARFAVAKLLWLYVHGRINQDMGAITRLYVEGTKLEGGAEVVKLRKVAPATVSA